MADEQTAPQLGLERIYVKDISLEVPSAEVFTKEWQPELDIGLTTTSSDLDEDHKEVILTVSVTAKNADRPHSSLRYNKQGFSCYVISQRRTCHTY